MRGLFPVVLFFRRAVTVSIVKAPVGPPKSSNRRQAPRQTRVRRPAEVIVAV